MSEAWGNLVKGKGRAMDANLIAQLRADLSGADWSVDGVADLLSPMAVAAMERDQLVPAAVELEENVSPVAVLTRLFVLAQPVAEPLVAQALPTLGVAGAQTLHLVAGPDDEGLVRATVDLRPHGGELPVFDGEDVVVGVSAHHWWVASDLSQAQTGLPPREDHVLGIASATTNLLGLTMRQRIGSALDLGCGCGILALYLAEHAGRVVATDISERACWFTRFNAALNEVEIEVRQGSLFDPVVGERFDLITSNPPFVITPQSVRERVNLEYRDGGMERDSLIPLVIKQAVDHLNPGGTLQMLANWEIEGDVANWALRPSRWVKKAVKPLLARGVSVDAWVVQRDLVDSAQYAQWWMRDALGDGVEAARWAREYGEWLRDFRGAGVGHVGLGFVALRIGADAEAGAEGTLNLVCEYLPDGPAADGLAVKCALDNLVFPTDWKTRVLVRAQDVREVRYLIPGSVDPELIRISQGRAGGRERSAASSVAALVGVSDGELTPEQVLPAIAHLLGEELDGTEETVAAALPELLRAGVIRFK